MNLQRAYRWVVAPVTIALVFLIGPLQSPDEEAHLFRVDALSNGSIFPIVVGSSPDKPAAGGRVDVGVREWVGRIAPSYGDAIVPMSRRFLWSTFDIHADGAQAPVAHSNTAIYPPFLYLPSSSAVAMARAASLPVATWLYAARLANALVAIAIVATLMRKLPRFRPVILVVASLPIVIFQSATASADAILLPVMIAFASLVASMWSEDGIGRAAIAALMVATILLCVGKVAYLPFAIFPPLAARTVDGRWSRRALSLTVASVVALLLWAAWVWLVRDKVFSIRSDVPVDPAGQLRWMLAHPLTAIEVLARSVTSQAPSLITTGIGSRLGILNLRLWHPLVIFGAATLLAAAFRRTTTAQAPRWFVVVVLASCAAMCATVVLLLYLQFNPVGQPFVQGMQGRYFLPPLVACLVFWPVKFGPSKEPMFDRIAALFAVASAVTTVVSVSNAYWTA